MPLLSRSFLLKSIIYIACFNSDPQHGIRMEWCKVLTTPPRMADAAAGAVAVEEQSDADCVEEAEGVNVCVCACFGCINSYQTTGDTGGGRAGRGL